VSAITSTLVQPLNLCGCQRLFDIAAKSINIDLNFLSYSLVPVSISPKMSSFNFFMILITFSRVLSKSVYFCEVKDIRDGRRVDGTMWKHNVPAGYTGAQLNSEPWRDIVTYLYDGCLVFASRSHVVGGNPIVWVASLTSEVPVSYRESSPEIISLQGYYRQDVSPGKNFSTNYGGYWHGIKSPVGEWSLRPVMKMSPILSRVCYKSHRNV